MAKRPTTYTENFLNSKLQDFPHL